MFQQMKSAIARAAFLLALITICTASGVSAQNLPAPGTVIDKTNIDQYKKLFPEEFIDAFTTGWGLIKPLRITVKESAPYGANQLYLELSQKNRDKYSLDKDGYITGGPYEEINGYPFPDVTPDDPDFAAKFMWNFDYRYRCDDQTYDFYNFSKRVGDQPVSYDHLRGYRISFSGRVVDDPKPMYQTKNKLRNVDCFKAIHPPVQRNFANMLGRYLDPKKADYTYMYLPSMRRVLRGEAGERSTPIMSSTQAPDDFNGFDGKTAEFTYTFVGKKKILGVFHSELDFDSIGDPSEVRDVPVEQNNWEVADVYVFDITPKSPKYPQSNKRIYINPDNFRIVYSIVRDRAENVWKIWQMGYYQYPLVDGHLASEQQNMLGLDIQLGYVCQTVFNFKNNGQGITEADCTISALRKMGR